MPAKPDPHRPQPSRTYRTIVQLLRPLAMILTRREWAGSENLPETGFIAVANHVSDADPFCSVHFLVDNGVYPAVLAKRELFNVPLLGRLLRAVGIIPVDRGSVGASLSLAAATTALHDDVCVLIYPEGTHTYDPDLWPMTAKTGAARLALRSGAPVVPIALWGAHEFRHPHTGKFRLRRFRSRVLAGPPIDLSAYGRDPDDYDAVCRATEKIMADLTHLVAELRGESPPAAPYDRSLGPPDTPHTRKGTVNRTWT